MSYLVLARKWRPTRFDDVIGQEHVTRTLENAIRQDRVHHAYLFAGARGVGKTTCARILARCLNCRAGDTATTEPCGECPSCLEISSGASVDVFEIDGASNRGIDEIRELREGVKYAPSRDRLKIYVIDEVHMLTEAAFNALLKTLEEPPPHVKFVFATTEPRKIPVTILSRCQRFDFKRVAPATLMERLRSILVAEEIRVDEAALTLLAREAEGSVRDALSLLDQVIAFAGQEISEAAVLDILGLTERRNFHELAAAVLGQDVRGALEIVYRIHGYGVDFEHFAAEWVQHTRDMLVIRSCSSPESLMELPSSEIQTISEQVQHTDPATLRRIFSLALEAAHEVSRSPQPRLVFEMAIARAADLAPTVDLSHLIERLEAVEARTRAAGGEQGGPPRPGPSQSPQRRPAGGSGDQGSPSSLQRQAGPEESSEQTAAAGQSRAPSRPAGSPAPERMAPPSSPDETIAEPTQPQDSPVQLGEEPAAAPTQPEPPPRDPAQRQPRAEAGNLWRKIVSAVEQDEAFLAGFLRGAYPIELTQESLRVTFENDGVAFEEARAETDRLSRIASDLAGHALEVRVETGHQRQPGDGEAPVLSIEVSDALRKTELEEQRNDSLHNHPVVATLRRELGAKVVDIRLGNASEAPEP